MLRSVRSVLAAVWHVTMLHTNAVQAQQGFQALSSSFNQPQGLHNTNPLQQALHHRWVCTGVQSGSCWLSLARAAAVCCLVCWCTGPCCASWCPRGTTSSCTAGARSQQGTGSPWGSNSGVSPLPGAGVGSGGLVLTAVIHAHCQYAEARLTCEKGSICIAAMLQGLVG
jgi:hypothetical protein